MKNQNILLFFIILLLLAVMLWQYNQIQTLETDFLNLQICIIEGIL